ncbi:MAG: hypothetical protein HUJ98_11115, partial [Bacteroidaceae bacterium]|nr:hypothetical protein [Bacteroidaceae bacterium]MCF0187024.1 hypothetical protein [Bacteroidaceae bacterium]
FMHSDATRLKEIEVYAQSVQPTKYGIVAIPNKEEQRQSSDAWMLMDRMMIPGLQIDVLNRKVTAANSQQVSYFINGVHAEIWEVVALSPQRISHIEFLASPPDPQYNNARWVLNFVLKEPDYGGYAMMEAEQGIVYHIGSIDVATKINRGRMTYLAMAAADYSNDNAISMDAEKEYRYAPDSVVVKVSNTKEWIDKQNYTGAFVARYDSKNVMLQGSAGFKYRRVSKDHSEIGNNYLYNGEAAHADAISDASGESYAPYIRLAWQFSNLPYKATLTGSASLTYNRNSAYNLYTVKEIPDPLQNDSKESAWIPFMALAYQVPVFGKNSLKLSADFSSERYNIDYIGTAQSHQRLINNDLNISIRYNHIFSDSWRGSFLVGVPVKAYKVNEQKFNTRAYFNAYFSLNGSIGRKHSFSGFAQIQQMTLQPEFYNTVIRQDDEMEGSQGAPNLKVPRFLSANFAHTWMASNLFSLNSSIGTYGVLDDLVPDFRPSNGLMIRTMVNSGDYYTLFATINPSLSLCNRKLRLNLYSYFAYEHHTGIYSLSLRNAVFRPSVAWDVSRHLSLSTQFSTSIGKAYMRGGTGANVARNFGSLVVVGTYSAGNLLLSARLNWSLRKSNGWEYWLDHSYLQEHYYSSRPSNNRFLLLTARYTFDFGRKMNHEEKASFEGTAKTAVLSR